MLQTMRAQAGHWFIKLILGAIMASFAFFGITDIIRSSTTNRPVATIGNYSIGMEEFAHAYKDALSDLQYRAKAAITPEQIKELGIGSHVLENLLNKGAMEEEMNHLGLVIPDAVMKREIQGISSFLTPSGIFDHALFKRFLESKGMTEARFIHEARRETQRHQLFSALTAGLSLSEDYLKLLYQALEQSFQFVAIQIPFNKMPLPKTVQSAELELFYKANKEEFRFPEFRTLTVLRFERTPIKHQMIVSEEELKQEYEKRRADFTSKETRHVEEILLASSEALKRTPDMFRGGKPLKAIARELKGTYRDLGEISQNDTPHGERIFSLDVGVMSKPIEHEHGWIIYVVTKVIPPSEKSFEEVRSSLESSIKDERFNDFFEGIQNQVEDALASGDKLSEISEKFGLVIESFQGIDKFGRDRDGHVRLQDNIRKDVLDYAFSNPQNSESQVISAKASGDDKKIDTDLVGVIVRVDTIHPSYLPTLENIKEKVKEAYVFDLQQKAASELATKIAKDIKSLDDLKKNAEGNKLPFVELPTISRATVDQNQQLKNEMIPESIEHLFSLPGGEAFVTAAKDGFKVIMLKEKIPFTIDQEKFKKFQATLQNMIKKDFQALYSFDLRHNRYPVNINQSQVDRIVGQ